MGVFRVFFNCTNGTKLCKASHIQNQLQRFWKNTCLSFKTENKFTIVVSFVHTIKMVPFPIKTNIHLCDECQTE